MTEFRLKNCTVLVAIMTLALVFSAYPGFAKDKIVLKMGLVESANLADAPATQGATVFKHIVESKAGDRVEIQLFPGGQLGWERELIEGLRMGTVEMAITSDGPVGGFFEPILILGIPYLFRNSLVAWEVLDGPFGNDLMEALRKKTGIRCLAITENGFRNFTNNKRPIRTPADMKGLKIRTMENPIHMAIVRSLGAAPTPISFGELYSSLQQGIVDGQENPVGVIHMIKAYEVQKYLIMDGHVYNSAFLWINDKVFQKLDPDLKQLFWEAAQVATFVERSGAKLLEATKLQTMKDKGMEIYVPSDEGLAAFRKMSQPVVIEEVKKMVKGDWVDRLFQAIDIAEKQLAQQKR